MNIILLSGGSGKRLWPLSNDIRSKQFIKIFQTDTGRYESMVQRIYRQIKSVDPDTVITIATSKNQVSAIHNQLGENVGISIEPCRRDTFAAIALATAYLHDIQGVTKDEAAVVCPVDPYVEESYFECIREMYEAAVRGEHNLVLMGIKPTYPSEKYGYIQPVYSCEGTCCFNFTEKPTKEKAEEYIAAGALWNGGVFAYKLEYVLGKARELLGTCNYTELFNYYENLKKISFDYAVVENETSIEVLHYNGQWKDLGTWNTLTEEMNEHIIGNGQYDDSCKNIHIINELDIPILAMGLKDVVIAASPDGVLVSDKDRSSHIKPYVDEISQQVMYAEKSWGNYKVIDIEERSMTIKVALNAGQGMNYHSHEKRDEVWTVISGSGKAVVDGRERVIKAGDVISMPSGCKHMVIAETELIMIEVQLGEVITIKDKHKHELTG